MLNFLKRGEHGFELGNCNIIQGIEFGLESDVVRQQILDLFPSDYGSLDDELHVNIMLNQRIDDTTIRYLPMAEICFVPENGKKLIHVRIIKRSPELGHVIFKDVDSFYGNDSRISEINEELVEILAKYYDFINAQLGDGDEALTT